MTPSPPRLSRMSTSSTSTTTSRSSRMSSISSISSASSLASSSSILITDRPLGLVEKSAAYKTALSLSTPGIVAATYSIPLDRDVVYAALEDVIFSEPLLAVTIRGIESKRPYLRKLDELDLDAIVTFDPHDTLRKAVNSLCTLDFEYDQGLPLWRLFVLASSELVFVYDQSILDDASGVHMHRRILHALARVPERDPATKVTNIAYASPSPIPPALESYFSFKSPRGLNLKGRFGKKPPQQWTGTMSSGKPSCTIFELSPQVSRRLSNNARQRGVSVTSIIYATLFQTIMGLTNPPVDCVATTELIIDSRRCSGSKPTSPISDSLGNFSFSATHSLTNFKSAISSYGFVDGWAKDFELNMRESRDGTDSAGYALSQMNPSDTRRALIAQAQDRQRLRLLELSDCGVCEDRLTVKDIDITKLVVVKPASVASGYAVGIASFRGGPLVVSISTAGEDSNGASQRIRDSCLAVLSNAMDT